MFGSKDSQAFVLPLGAGVRCSDVQTPVSLSVISTPMTAARTAPVSLRLVGRWDGLGLLLRW